MFIIFLSTVVFRICGSTIFSMRGLCVPGANYSVPLWFIHACTLGSKEVETVLGVVSNDDDDVDDDGDSVRDDWTLHLFHPDELLACFFSYTKPSNF